MIEPSDIDKLLSERGKTHGDYAVHAGITQRLKSVMHATPYWPLLTDTMKETLEMNAHKIGRILAGNPAFPDHWADIAGYARLVEKELISSLKDDPITQPRLGADQGTGAARKPAARPRKRGRR